MMARRLTATEVLQISFGTRNGTQQATENVDGGLMKRRRENNALLLAATTAHTDTAPTG